MTSHKSGSAIIVILMAILILSACMVGAMGLTSQIGRSVQRTNTLQKAIEIGDGALDYAYAHWRAISVANSNVTLNSNDFSAIPLPTATSFPSIPNLTASRGANPSSGAPYTLSNFQVQACDEYWNPLSDPKAGAKPSYGRNLGAMSYFYRASVDVTLPAVGGNVTAKVRRIYSKAQESPWNYAIFFNDDLEMNPGPAQTINGWVHSNHGLFTAQNSLTLQSKVTFTGSHDNNYSPQDSRRTTTPQAGPHFSPDFPARQVAGIFPFGIDPTSFVTSDPNNTGYHELVEPKSGTGNDPLSAARYATNADLRITVGNNSGVPTLLFEVNDSSASGGFRTIDASSSSTADKLLYAAVAPAVQTGAQITDKREGSIVTLTDIDMGLLDRGIVASGQTFRGTIYISDNNAPDKDTRGVRLKNGSILSARSGYTVATDRALYIQGDYNSGRAVNAETPSNLGDPTKPTVAGYDKKPCAVIADAVMLLSNSWQDASSSLALTSRIASPTTINTAIVSGNVPSKNGAYSGGEENFPRFLEDWTNKNLTYYGSMVELYPSKTWAKAWGSSQVYAAPNRRWYFDLGFYTNPPPGTLQIIQYAKGRWFLE